MPVIKSAKKKLRKDILREKRNNSVRIALKKALNVVKKKSSEENVKKAVRIADKAAKNHIIHKNKAARIKSNLSKFVTKPTKSTKTKVAKK